MYEITFIILKAILTPVLNVLVNAAWTRNPTRVIDNLHSSLNGMHIKKLVEEAKGILDEGKGHDLKRLKNLATIITEGEIYGDIIKYTSNHNIEGNTNRDILQTQLGKLEKTLTDLISELSEKPSEKKKDKHAESQSSGPEKAGEMPPRNVRRLLLYLSPFPKKYVFNRQRISRLLDAYEFIAADSGEPLLQHLANWLDPAESNWDGDGAPNHFLIGNDVKNRTPTWPEQHNLVREALAESIESIKYGIFLSSLIFLGKRDYTLKLNNDQFLFLKVLSLRNGKLENGISLKKLSFLKYLDLKYTIVDDCTWLEGLEELEMLDLRYTGVEEIPEKYLEKLGKLQHLLLGYRPNKTDNSLSGAKLNTQKLTKNLKTLRAIRQSNKINVSLKVTDLSVTGLKKGDLKLFWDAVGQFENLTRLGVSVIKTSEITLQDCPAKLKDKLKRLRMEGLHSGFEKLSEFVNLVDLTLAPHKRINIESIPQVPNLFCLRLYSFCTDETLILRGEGFSKLKKLVIGDMKKVKTVKIASDVIKTVETLKLCNLPELSELSYHDSDSQPLLLRRRKNETVPIHREITEDHKSHKSIFLRGFENINFDKGLGLKIYHYDMNNQCYQEVPAIQPHDNQI